MCMCVCGGQPVLTPSQVERVVSSLTSAIALWRKPAFVFASWAFFTDCLRALSAVLKDNADRCSTVSGGCDSVVAGLPHPPTPPTSPVR